MVSPSLIDSVGHSGKQAPQAIQSSVIFIAIGFSPYKLVLFWNISTDKRNRGISLCQMTNIIMYGWNYHSLLTNRKMINLPGPWTPMVNVISISAFREGPAMSTAQDDGVNFRWFHESTATMNIFSNQILSVYADLGQIKRE